MAMYSVLKSDFKKSFDGKYGETHVYNLVLSDGGEQAIDAEILMKPTTKPPEQGETIEGELSKGEYGWKFKKANPRGFTPHQYTPAPGGSSASMAHGDDREAQIIRQHSQHMAVLWSAVLLKVDRMPKDFDNQWLKSLVDWFDIDVRQNSGKTE